MSYDWKSVPLPDRMRRLPKDDIGRPIPWFVLRDDNGIPDFRIIRRGGIEDAVRFSWCWVCGQPRGRHAASLIGPMCCVNRVSAEPPAHLECALYSARACPFMANPGMRRRPVGEDVEHVDPAGTMITRNPGVGLVWSSKTWATFVAPTPDGHRGILFDVGEPTDVSWWAHGRPATAREVATSILTGLPILRDEAHAEGPKAVAEFRRRLILALALVPEGAAQLVAEGLKADAA